MPDFDEDPLDLLEDDDDGISGSYCPTRLDDLLRSVIFIELATSKVSRSNLDDSLSGSFEVATSSVLISGKSPQINLSGRRSTQSKFPIYCDLIWQPKGVDILETSFNGKLTGAVSCLLSAYDIPSLE